MGYHIGLRHERVKHNHFVRFREALGKHIKFLGFPILLNFHLSRPKHLEHLQHVIYFLIIYSGL